ncbi:hypothetical protein [Microvirga sp. M2]|uniref:hypothetical protein n=1 Tax=Microvirga sp. M2 TaxID=3073270 RepID=UPI0039C3DB9C
MRFFVTAVLCLGIVMPMAAEAQTARLPRKSVNERQVEDINRNIQEDQRLKSLQQQNQVEHNLLRQNLDRDRLFSRPPGACPPGAVRCY